MSISCLYSGKPCGCSTLLTANRGHPGREGLCTQICRASAPPIALLVQQSVLGLYPYVSGDSTQVTVNTPAWQPGQKRCFHWPNPSHTSPERPSTPQDHSVPQAASLQSAWSLGLYKHYFLMRTIVGILEMPGDKTLRSMPGQCWCPARSGGVANKPDWVASPAPWLFHCFAAWSRSLSFKSQFTFCVLQPFPTPCYGIL